jgi:hypothetical protein
MAGKTNKGEPAESEPRSYEVLDRIDTADRSYRPGDLIALTDEQAERLGALGVIASAPKAAD